MTKNRMHHQIHRMISKIVTHTRKKSPWLLHFDCGSCNGCDIEVLACMTPGL
ncbi:MAG: hypothetical protein R2875_00040 [Desulfobacterales bacterium]